jgi:hypothetical protein
MVSYRFAPTAGAKDGHLAIGGTLLILRVLKNRAGSADTKIPSPHVRFYCQQGLLQKDMG